MDRLKGPWPINLQKNFFLIVHCPLSNNNNNNNNNVYYKYISVEISYITEPFIHDKHSRQKSMPIGNSQLSKTGYESCLLYYTVYKY